MRYQIASVGVIALVFVFHVLTRWFCGPKLAASGCPNLIILPRIRDGTSRLTSHLAAN